MAQPDLTSHHVNYLIWRYLQEAGHGDAAVSLQRAWYPNPQSLPFAPYIKTHALVSLVQKGLQYHEMEASLDKEGNRINISPSDYFFGPEPSDTGSAKSHDEAVGTDAGSPGQVARDRLVNGHVEPGKDETDSDESMEEDKVQTESQPESPEHHDDDGDISMADEIPELPALENGHTSGVLIAPAKPVDLTPNTALLDVEYHVTRALWHPRDPTVVVGAGELFCSLWKLSTAAEPEQKQVLQFKKGATTVSTVAWDATGDKLAVATTTDDRGTITMYNVNGDAVDLLPEVPRVITGLHWAEGSSQLVVVASNHNVSELALWDDSQRPDVFPPPQVIEDQVHALAWCGRNLVFAAGDNTVYQCDVDNGIRLANTFSSPSDVSCWNFIRCVQSDSHSVAIAASGPTRAIWIPTYDIYIPNAHDARITGLDIRSQSHGQLVQFASFSADGKVKVWRVDLNLKDYTCIHQLSLESSSPVLAGSFSPDGYAVAAFSKARLSIWNVERGGEPVSTWTAPNPEVKKEEADRLTNGQNGHHGQNGYRTSDSSRPLSWDADGKRLVCGFDKQMAIINLQR